MNLYTPKIPKQQLIHGVYYYGSCRNASIARWNAEIGRFIHWRTKFGDTFLEEISAPEDEAQFDVFVTERIVTIEEFKQLIPIPFTDP